MCFKQEGADSTLSGKPLKFLHHFIYLGSNILFTESDIHIYPTPPLGQDMTLGQFFKRSLTGLSSEFSLS